MIAFQLLDLTLIGRGGLLARGRFQLPSGLIVAANVLRSKKDPDKVFVLPVAERQQGGGYSPIVDFASAELREAWQNAALEAIRPRWKEIMQGGSAGQGAANGSF